MSYFPSLPDNGSEVNLQVDQPLGASYLATYIKSAAGHNGNLGCVVFSGLRMKRTIFPQELF